MYRSSLFKASLLLLITIAPQIQGNSLTEFTSEEFQTHLKTMISAAFVNICETMHLDEKNVNIYSPSDDTTFTGTTTGNGYKLFDRISRLLGITEPTITIATTTSFNEHDKSLENKFKAVLFKYAAAHAPFCQDIVDNDKNALKCTITYTMQEFYDLQKKYEEKPA